MLRIMAPPHFLQNELEAINASQPLAPVGHSAPVQTLPRNEVLVHSNDHGAASLIPGLSTLSCNPPNAAASFVEPMPSAPPSASGSQLYLSYDTTPWDEVPFSDTKSALNGCHTASAPIPREKPKCDHIVKAITEFREEVNALNDPGFCTAHRPIPPPHINKTFTPLAVPSYKISPSSEMSNSSYFCECRPLVHSQRLDKLKKIFSDVSDLVPYRTEFSAAEVHNDTFFYKDSKIMGIVHIARNGFFIMDSKTSFGTSAEESPARFFATAYLNSGVFVRNVLFTRVDDDPNLKTDTSFNEWTQGEVRRMALHLENTYNIDQLHIKFAIGKILLKFARSSKLAPTSTDRPRLSCPRETLFM